MSHTIEMDENSRSLGCSAPWLILKKAPNRRVGRREILNQRDRRSGRCREPQSFHHHAKVIR